MVVNREKKIRQNAEKMLIAFLEHWEHSETQEAWGPAAYGLPGGALAKLANIEIRRGELQASLRLLEDKRYILRCAAPDLWISDIVPLLKKIHGEGQFVSPQMAKQLLGESSDPDYCWYVLTEGGRERARWLRLSGWRRVGASFIGYVRRHWVAIIIGFIIGFIASYAASLVFSFPKN